MYFVVTKRQHAKDCVLNDYNECAKSLTKHGKLLQKNKIVS